MTKSTFLSTLILVLASWLGLWAFLYPFFLPAVEQQDSLPGLGMAHTNDAPFIFVLLLGLWGGE